MVHVPPQSGNAAGVFASSADAVTPKPSATRVANARAAKEDTQSFLQARYPDLNIVLSPKGLDPHVLPRLKRTVGPDARAFEIERKSGLINQLMAA